MTRAPLSDGGAAARLNDEVTRWATEWSGAPVGVEHRGEPDSRGHFHWLLRLRGEEKPVVTVWLSLRQRTVAVETEVMGAPEENHEELYRYLLSKNHDLRELHVSIGPEAGIYLVARIPVGEVTAERLDEVVGATLTYVEEIYPTAASIGFASTYRRRRSR